MPIKVSVIIPTYNEQAVIANCLDSLLKQDLKDLEIIVVDDGSADKTLEVLYRFKGQIKLLQQKHQGPGKARNLGAKSAAGKILIFVDADMEFHKNFLEKLIDPIEKEEVVGTFSKEEYLLNKENAWARFWNVNLGRSPEKMHPENYPETQPVFRAILKSEFEKAGGFETKVGYTDDWSLSRKLGVEAVNAKGAVFYHKNPENLKEVWQQARWFGKNEFLTGGFIRKIYNIFRYDLMFAVIKGIYGSIKLKDLRFLIFKMVYDSAVTTSVLLSFFKEQKYK